MLPAVLSHRYGSGPYVFSLSLTYITSQFLPVTLQLESKLEDYRTLSNICFVRTYVTGSLVMLIDFPILEGRSYAIQNDIIRVFVRRVTASAWVLGRSVTDIST